MLKEKNILNSILSNFAKWMDIRKRVNSSNGGAIVSSISEEITNNINNSIKDYQDMFFIGKNIESPESIISKAYYINIGNANIDKIVINYPTEVIIVQLKDFMITSNDNLAYYEDGFLYFNKNHKNVNINVDGYKISKELTAFDIWNIYDEFAMFCGLKRYDDETNKQLLNRILNKFNNTKNSSSEGLKNIIIDSIMNLDVPISKDEIIIERPNNNNLMKIYNDKTRIIDELNKINHDVYDTKRWNLDLWEHPFKSIKYIPCMYDVILDKYVNGIGDDNDLLIEIEKDSNSTSADIMIYEKQEYQLSKYIKEKNIQSRIQLNLKKYNDELKVKNNKYTITASKAIDITNNNIYIQGNKEELINDFINMESIISNDVNDSLKTINNRVLKNGHKYKFTFKPSTDFGYANISEFKISDQHTTENMLIPKDGYAFINGKLTSTTTKFYTNSLNDFYYYNNMINYNNCIVMDSIVSNGALKLDISKYSNNRIVLKHGSSQKLFDYNNLVSINFTLNDNYVSSTRTNPNEEKIIFNRDKVNAFSFKLIKGSITLQIKTVNNGKETIRTLTMDENSDFASEKGMTPNTSFIITGTSDSIVIKDLKYEKYEMKMSLTNKELIYLQDQTIILPDFVGQNSLNIEICPIDKLVPYIEYIHIGESIKNSIYTSDIILITSTDKTVSLQTNCLIELTEYDSNNNIINTIDNYDPSSEYIASEKTFVKLNLSNFGHIESITAENAKIEMINNEYYVLLNKNQSIRKIFITGKRNTQGPKVYLNSILNIDSFSKIYCCELIDGFVIEKDNIQAIRKILKDDLPSDYIDNVKIYNIPDNCSGIFKLYDKTIINDSTSIDFLSLGVIPKDSLNYIAFNEYNSIMELVENIDMVDLFNPLINKDILYGFTVSSNDAEVKFYENNILFENSKNWTIGRKNVSIYSRLLSDIENYNYENIELIVNVPLSQSVGLDDTYVVDSTIINLQEYMVSGSDCEISYSRRPINPDFTVDSDFLYSFNFVVDSTMFKKLKHSNIDDILYIGTEMYSPGKKSDTSIIFNLHKDEGILSFDNRSLIGNKIYIIYSFKKPNRINISLYNLYNMIDNNILAYKMVRTIELNDITDKYEYNLDSIGYDDSINKVIVNFKNSGFDAIKKEKIIYFTKISKNDVLTVRPGYYYYGEKEYYYNINTAKNTINKTDTIIITNGEIVDNILKLSESSTNYTKNSYMQLGNNDSIHQINFDKTKINLLNKMDILTPCDTIGNFKTFGMDTGLTKGFNEDALILSKTIPNGYSSLNITKYVDDNSYISMIYKGEGKFYIYNGYNYDGSTKLKKVKDFELENFDEEFSRAFINIGSIDNKKEYFIIITGDSLIDDILISNEVIEKNHHIKNINFFNMSFNEPNTKNNKIKRLINGKLGFNKNTGSLDDGTVVMCPKIKYNTTLEKRYYKYNSFDGLNLQNVSKESISGDVFLKTKNIEGTILSDPIFINSAKTIEKLSILVNSLDDINNNNNNVKIKIFSSYFKNKEYNLIKESDETMTSIPSSYLKGSRYIKFSISIPKNYTIENLDILIDYKEDIDNEFFVSEQYDSYGIYETMVYDTQYQKDYTLTDIGISNVNNLSNILLEITGAKKTGDKIIWYPYKKIELDENLKIKNYILLNDIYYFKIRATIRNKDSRIKLNYVELTGGEE